MDLRDYVRIALARKWIVVATILVTTLAAIGVSLVVPPNYRGEATILVSEKDFASELLGLNAADSSNPQRGFQTQMEILQSRTIAEAAVRQSGLQVTPEDLMARVAIAASVQANQSNLATIRVTDRDPQRAATLANAMAQSYIDWSRDTKKARIAVAVEKLQKRLDSAEAQVILLEKTARPGKGGNSAAALTAATQLYSALSDRLETLRMNEELEIGNGQFITRAVASAGSRSPKPMSNGMLGAALGLILGLGVAFLVESSGDRQKRR